MFTVALLSRNGGLLRDHGVDGDLVGGGSRAVDTIAALSDGGGGLLGGGGSGRDNDVLGVSGSLANADLLLDVDDGLAGVVASHLRRSAAGALGDVGGVVLGDGGGLSRNHLSSANSVSLTGLTLVY